MKRPLRVMAVCYFLASQLAGIRTTRPIEATDVALDASAAKSATDEGSGHSRTGDGLPRSARPDIVQTNDEPYSGCRVGATFYDWY